GTGESDKAHDEPPAACQAPARQRPAVDWRMAAAGTLAVLALTACAWLGYRTLTAPAESYRSMLARLHAQLPFLTLLYFAAGTAFFAFRGRKRAAKRAAQP
ncbi:MAG: hypothetical protein OXD30_01890, partial [Bryobacterales bacterium]|nr:hypothetical protein [Bryobacterales bacterium]